MDVTESIKERVEKGLKGSTAVVFDTTGTGDHLAVEVLWPNFEGLSRIEQHRKVYGCVQSLIDDGTIHALQIKTKTEV